MKILIGTPIHMIKDYCMERWLDNVAKLQKVTPADLLLVDNSPGTDYVEKVKGYCNQLDLKKYEIKHLEIPEEIKVYERVARSREIIREFILNYNYDIWFSWECDQIIPVDSLKKLIKLMVSGNFTMVNHNGWSRENNKMSNYDWGVALIKKQILEKYSFILEFGTDPEMPDTWEPGEKWFKQRVLRGGDGFIEVDGIVEPILHLNK